MSIPPTSPVLPGLGQIPSSQNTQASRGITPGFDASGVNAGTSFTPQQYEQLFQTVNASSATQEEKQSLFNALRLIQSMSIPPDGTFSPEQMTQLEQSVANASPTVQSFVQRLKNLFPGQPSALSSPDQVALSNNNGNSSAPQLEDRSMMATYKPEKKRNFFQRILDAIIRLFTGKPKDSNEAVFRQVSGFGPTDPQTQFGGGQSAGRGVPAGGYAGSAEPAYQIDTDASSGDIYGKSNFHDENKFVPTFAISAYHESGVMRKEGDPYAVGGISNPSRSGDLGGKSYGPYQFESSTYADGNVSRDPQRSTLARFINDPSNPYGAQLKAAAQQHGLASAQFDNLWKQLAANDNKAFGQAQEQFMLKETQGQAQNFFNLAGLGPEVQQNAAMRDLVIGTVNQVGGLAEQAARHLKQKATEMGRPLSTKEAANALIDFKRANIPNWFRSSPGAHQGVANRYADEKQHVNTSLAFVDNPDAGATRNA